MMFCTHKAIVKYCGSYKTVALLILYPTAYLTYYFSGLRQGIVMTCFFGILLGWLLDKKYVRYVIGVLLLTSIHLAALIYLLVPIILCMNRRIYLVGTVLSAIFAICMYWDPIRNIVIYVAGHFGKAATYFGTPSISKFSLLERMLMLALVFFLIWRKERKQEANKECYIPFLKIYYAGFLLYICLCTNPLVSSRLAIMLKVVEFLLIPMLLSETEELVKRGTVLLLCIVSCGMSYKNLNSYIVQGKYKAGISAFNYPYVTVFNYEDILNYRESFEYEPFDFKEEELIRAGEF